MGTGTDAKWQGGTPLPFSDFLDTVVCPDVGAIIVRDIGAWHCLDPSTPGYVLTTQGSAGPPYWGPGGTAYAAPAFTAFAITGVSSPMEVGASISAGSYTFTWSTSNSANVAANSISITDVTGSTILASGLANTGSHAITLGTITETDAATYLWRIAGVNTQSGSFTRDYSVTWLWRVYAGTNASATLTANQIKALSDSSNLQAAFSGTYTYADALGYKYFSYPDEMGSVSSFVDANTGFPVDIATVSDNAAYSNLANGWYYALVSVTNANGAATNYRVYRTTYSFSGSFSMRVS